MKKVFAFLFASILIFNSGTTIAQTIQQVKISEINPDDNIIEFFSTGPSLVNLDCYTLVSYMDGAGGTPKGYYVIDFPSMLMTSASFNASAPNYLVCGPTVTAQQPSEFTWIQGTTYYTKFYPIDASGVQQSPVNVTSTLEKIFMDKPVVFLLKNKNIVDLFVSGLGQTVTTVQAGVNALPTLQVSVCGDPTPAILNFTQQVVTVANFQVNYTTASTGQSSFDWTTSGNCDNAWSKSASSYNTGSISTSLKTWDDNFYHQGISGWVNLSANTDIINFPSQTFSFKDINNDNIIDSVVFLAEVESPANFTPPTSMTVKVFRDNGGNNKNNGVFSADPEITTLNLAFISGSSSTYFYRIGIGMDQLRDGSLDVLYNIFVQMTTATGATQDCFSTVTLLKFPLLSALPVTLSAFSVKHVNNFNTLSWRTSTESNNKGFEVQRSINGTNDFKTIGFVGTRAKDGNSQTEISYTFEDKDVKAGQVHYYRLNQLDFDGKSSLSQVRSVKPGSIESNLSVYPNPSQGNVTVNTGSASGKLNIYVMDNSGRIVSQYMNVSTSNTRINNLKKGLYTLKIVNTETGEQSAQRVVVQ
jgi:hypothetical protein